MQHFPYFTREGRSVYTQTSNDVCGTSFRSRTYLGGDNKTPSKSTHVLRFLHSFSNPPCFFPFALCIYVSEDGRSAWAFANSENGLPFIFIKAKKAQYISFDATHLTLIVEALEQNFLLLLFVCFFYLIFHSTEGWEGWKGKKI